MKIILAAMLTLGAWAPARAVTLTGAGATFPFPIYSKWFDEYHKVRPDVEINYQSIGSGGGISQITRRTVDFGASDAPMTDKQLFKVDGKLLHLPTVLGAVVPIYNVPGVPELRLGGPVLADIFLGKVKSWDDPAIKAENPEAKLPSAPITVVHRADGSGTTFCFVDFLTKVSKDWQKTVGRGAAVRWPVGLGGKGNEGVAGLVKQTPNAIGYAELIYAVQNGIAYAAVKNAKGNYVKADIASVSEAAAGAPMPEDFRVSLTNPPGAKAYPIATFTWLLVYEKSAGGKGPVIADFLRWMLKDGQNLASELGYAPLHESVKSRVEKAVETLR